MAKKLPGETYQGTAITVPLSSDGQISAYVWPLRILTVQRDDQPKTMGGPTIGVDVGNEEVIRFDCHGNPGHWHRGGYDRLERPGNSHVEFPDGINAVDTQVSWALDTLNAECASLLTEAEHAEAANKVDSDLLKNALEAIKNHLAQSDDYRQKSIDQNIINYY
ncbi:MAG TPA: hypothetical protein DEZ08_06390 [Dehalococcoidia bacterium]|jgi:hypothetical protein|nr:hypothetical protein [Dehalococcoidia bacterium]